MNTYPFYVEKAHITGANTSFPRSSTNLQDDTTLMRDVSNKINMWEPTKSPFVTLLTNVGMTMQGKAYVGSPMLKRTTSSVEFECFEDTYGGRFAKVSGALADNATEIPVVNAGSDSGYIFTVGDVIKNIRTGEQMTVSTVNADPIVVVRAQGTTAAAAMVDGDDLMIIGNVNAEGSGARNVNVTTKFTSKNYVQILKKTVAITNTAKELATYGGDEQKFQREKAGVEFKKDIERTFWFGEKKLIAGQLPKRLTGGVVEYLEAGDSYIQDQNGALTSPDFNTYLRNSFQFGDTGTKMMFCGALALQAINDIVSAKIQTRPLEKTYGMAITSWQSPFGTVNFVLVPQDIWNGEYAQKAITMDINAFKYVALKNRDTKLNLNVQANDADMQIDEYIAEIGLERTFAPAHSILSGITI